MMACAMMATTTRLPAVGMAATACSTGTTKKLQITRSRLNADRTYHIDVCKLAITIKAGWKAGTKLTYENYGDEVAPGIQQDIVFVIKEKPHPRFKRDGNNLVMTSKISLCEALTGDSIQVMSLDGRSLQVPLRNVVSPDDCRVVSGQGMPIAKSPKTRGDLVVKFQVTFPRTLSDQQKAQLRTILS